MNKDVRGRIVLHVYDPEDWRKRRSDHPTDPGWETGTYSACHENVRKNAERGDWILDAIVYKNRDEKYIGIRSMFQVSRVKDDVLYFDEYWLAKGPKPTKLTCNDIRDLRADLQLGNGLVEEMQRVLRSAIWLRGDSFAGFVNRLKGTMRLRRPSGKVELERSAICKGCSR